MLVRDIREAIKDLPDDTPIEQMLYETNGARYSRRIEHHRLCVRQRLDDRLYDSSAADAADMVTVLAITVCP